MQKLLSIVKSLDFWVLTFGWLSEFLAKIAAEGFSNEVLLMQIFYWLSSVLALGKINTVIKGYRHRTTEIAGNGNEQFNSYTL